MNRALGLSLAARAMSVAAAALFVGTSCTENLPSGPNTFAAHLSILATHDTAVVGDADNLTAKTTDDSGRDIQNLSFAWTSSDTTVLGVATAATVPATTGDTAGHVKTFRAKHTGRSVVTLALPDSRYSVQSNRHHDSVVSQR